MLRRLHTYTLRWGWLGPAAIVIPWSFLSYAIERRSIRRQLERDREINDARTAEVQETAVFSPLIYVQTGSAPQQRSLFRVIVGWASIVLCLLFAATGAVLLFQGDFGGAIGGGIAGLVFWWIGRDWIRKGRGIQNQASEKAE